MVVARSIKEVFDFVTKADQEGAEETRTTFHLRTLPNDTLLRISDLLTKDGNKAAFELAIRAGMDGWTNLRNKAGEELAAARDTGTKTIRGIRVTEPLSEACWAELWDALDLPTMGAVVEGIVAGNTLTDDDVKN